MKFRFEEQPHQAEAIDAVTELFEGALFTPRRTLAGQAEGAAGHSEFRLEEDLLAERLKAVTAAASVETQDRLQLLTIDDLHEASRSFPNFSVEMETGTGKTIVYLATALRMAQVHGLRKFVVLTHSVAIRAGVVKTLEQTREWLQAKFSDVPYSWGILGEATALNDFLEPSNTVQFLIVSVQLVDKPKTGVVYQEAEQAQLWGQAGSGIASIAAARPVVIIDEPQNFNTSLRRRAIATLDPLVALRYSATHKEQFNLVHRLGAKDAADQGLVKRVRIKGVIGGDTGQPFVRLDKLRSKSKRLFAEVTIDTTTSPRQAVVLQNGDDLFDMSGGLDTYRGLVVDRFERKPDRMILQNGKEIAVGEEIGSDRQAIWRDQIRHTIRTHLERESQIDKSNQAIKVLSLFFVDRVADYHGPNAPLPAMFDRIFAEEWRRSRSTDPPDPERLRTHYFPSTKAGVFKDAVGASERDEEQKARAYQEIIANKELILVKSNPRAFIFSHSALKEGWDNPNVFQIGFLRHSGSDIERRQQIGRGLRLPVDETGRRVHDPAIARLTLIIDETFAEFRSGINEEYAKSGTSVPPLDNADEAIPVRRRPEKFASPEFAKLWERIRYRARFTISLDASTVPPAVAASELLAGLRYITKRANSIESADLEYDADGRVITADEAVSEDVGSGVSITGQRLPDLVRLIEDELLASKFPLQLTRKTVAAIVAAVPTELQRRAIEDPVRWARIVAAATRTVIVEHLVRFISYEPGPDSEAWDANMIFLPQEEHSVTRPAASEDPQYGVRASPPGGSNLYDHVVYDSHVERSFASQLENNNSVKLFTKLPRRFRIRTPVGEYSPDWAITYDNGTSEYLYLVRETKDSLSFESLRWDEAMRIRFARRHFEVAPHGDVDFQYTTDKDGLRLSKDGDVSASP